MSLFIFILFFRQGHILGPGGVPYGALERVALGNLSVPDTLWAPVQAAGPEKSLPVNVQGSRRRCWNGDYLARFSHRIMSSTVLVDNSSP